MQNKKIVIDDAVPYAEEIFSHLGEVTKIAGRAINSDAVKQADALIVRSRTLVNKELLENSKVSFVGSTVVGLDHIDQPYLKQKQIEFYSAQGCNANSVAEYVITNLLNLAEQFQFNISEKSLGIIGVGNVGEKVYNKAKALGMQILLNDPPKVERHPELEDQHNYVDLDSCLKADIITLHTPLTNSGLHPTRDLISATKLSNINPDQIIINAARGGIINEQAWKNAITQANVIDCWENEPNIDMELYAKAWIATPHIAGHSLDAKVAGSSMVYQKLCKYWQVQPQQDWQAALPEPPPIRNFEAMPSLQNALCKLMNETHNIFADDNVIRDKEASSVHKKYEYYRRNFPIYREWAQHRIQLTGKTELDNLLIQLGFKVSQS